MKKLICILTALISFSQDSLKIDAESFNTLVYNATELARRVELFQKIQSKDDSIRAVLSAYLSADSVGQRHVDEMRSAYQNKINLMLEDLKAANNRAKWANRFTTSAFLYPTLDGAGMETKWNLAINAAVVGIQWIGDFQILNLFDVKDKAAELVGL